MCLFRDKYLIRPLAFAVINESARNLELLRTFNSLVSTSTIFLTLEVSSIILFFCSLVSTVPLKCTTPSFVLT